MNRKIIKQVEVKVKIPYVCLTIDDHTNIVRSLLDYSVFLDHEDGIVCCLTNLMEIHMWNEEKEWIRKNKSM